MIRLSSIEEKLGTTKRSCANGPMVGLFSESRRPTGLALTEVDIDERRFRNERFVAWDEIAEQAGDL